MMDHVPDDSAMRRWLDEAYAEAQAGWNEGGIPIGSVLVDPQGDRGRGTIVARGRNLRVQSLGGMSAGPGVGDPTAHAEISCLRNAGRRRDFDRLVLVSTLSPCPLCSGAAILFRVPHVVIGEHRTFMGAEETMRAAGIRLSVLDDPRCVDLMQRIQREKPDLWAEDIGL